MQNANPLGQSIVQNSPETQQKIKTLREKVLEKVPAALINTGMVTQEDWALMDESTKIQLLESAGINPEQFILLESQKLEIEQASNPNMAFENSQSAVEQNPANMQIESAGIIDQQPKAISEDARIEEIRKQFSETKKSILENEAETARTLKNFPSPEEVAESIKQKETESLSSEDKQRIDVETGASLVRAVPKLSGYTPSQSVASNADDKSKNGSISDASTWVATLLQKIWLSLR